MRILIVGFGDVAAHLSPLLAPRHQLFALTRDPHKARHLRDKGILPIVGDLDHLRTLHPLAGLAHAVFHFAPPQSDGPRDLRTRRLVAALGRASLPQRLVYISTTGVYGDRAGAPIDETRRVNAQTPRAQRRVDAETVLRHWAVCSGCSLAILRVPGIYGPGRVPVARLKQGTPALREEDDVYTNHIHIEDLARACLAALARGKPNRVYNVTDDSDMKMGAYFDCVADAFQLPRPPRISREEAQTSISPNLLSFMSESRRIGNRRMKRELGLRLRYPSVVEGLAACNVATSARA